jgi:hypothetical protein
LGLRLVDDEDAAAEDVADAALPLGNLGANLLLPLFLLTSEDENIVVKVENGATETLTNRSF